MALELGGFVDILDIDSFILLNSSPIALRPTENVLPKLESGLGSSLATLFSFICLCLKSGKMTDNQIVKIIPTKIKETKKAICFLVRSDFNRNFSINPNTILILN